MPSAEVEGEVLGGEAVEGGVGVLTGEGEEGLGFDEAGELGEGWGDFGGEVGFSLVEEVLEVVGGDESVVGECAAAEGVEEGVGEVVCGGGAVGGELEGVGGGE